MSKFNIDSIHEKTSQKIKNREELPELNKIIYKTPIAHVTPNNGDWALPLFSGMRRGCLLPSLLFHTVVGLAGVAISQGKDTDVIQIGREETELCFCRNKNVKHNTIYHLKNMQYLGAYLTKHMHELYIENNKMQMKEILKDLNK